MEGGDRRSLPNFQRVNFKFEQKSAQSLRCRLSTTASLNSWSNRFKSYADEKCWIKFWFIEFPGSSSPNHGSRNWSTEITYKTLLPYNNRLDKHGWNNRPNFREIPGQNFGSWTNHWKGMWRWRWRPPIDIAHKGIVISDLYPWNKIEWFYE